MLRLDKVIKPWKESAALNDHINLYGFWNETAFLTKSPATWAWCSVFPAWTTKVSTAAEQEYAVKRLEAALKAFGPASMSTNISSNQTGRRFHSPTMTIRWWRPPSISGGKFFEAKRDHLYQIEIFYVHSARRREVEDRRRRRTRSTIPRSRRSDRRTEGAVHEQQHEDAAADPDRA